MQKQVSYSTQHMEIFQLNLCLSAYWILQRHYKIVEYLHKMGIVTLKYKIEKVNKFYEI